MASARDRRVVLKLVVVLLVEGMANLRPAAGERTQYLDGRARVVRNLRGVRAEKLKARLIHDARSQDRRLGNLRSMHIGVVVGTARDQVEAPHAGILNVAAVETIADCQGVIGVELVVNARVNNQTPLRDPENLCEGI